jgi:PAS domain-containing protein
MASGWRIAAERLPVAVLATDAHGHVRAFNRLVTATFSTEPELIEGASIGRLILEIAALCGFVIVAGKRALPWLLARAWHAPARASCSRSPCS